MFTYEQSTGRLLNDAGEVIGIGYSGAGENKNQPASQNLHDQGPIPQGTYTIGVPIPYTEEHGPFVLPLIPEPGNEMFGRSGFLMHGDAIHAPGTASKGCIILSRDVRNMVWESDDHRLQVVSD